MENCEFTNFSNRVACFTDVNNIIIDGNKFVIVAVIVTVI